MKQTNNANKFLMAQYRSVFKRAYVKGLFSAVTLTAGFVAGGVQAASIDYTSLTTEHDDDTPDEPEALDTLEFYADEAGTPDATFDNGGFLISASNSSGTAPSDSQQWSNVSGTISVMGKTITFNSGSIADGQRIYAKNVTISASGTSGGKLEINLDNDEHMMFTGNLKIASGGTFIINGAIDGESHVNGAIKEDPKFEDFTGNLIMESGSTLTMTNSHIEVGSANINGGTLNFSGTISEGDSWDKNAGLIAGGLTDGSGSEFEINGGAVINLNLGAALTSEVDTTLNVGESTINLAGGETENFSSFILAKDTANFNSGSKIKVSGAGTGIYGANLNFNSGASIDIAQAGVLNIDGDLQFSTEAEGAEADKKNGSTRDAGIIKVNGATITNAGILNIGPNAFAVPIETDDSVDPVTKTTEFTMTAGELNNTGTLNVSAMANLGSYLKNSGILNVKAGTTTTTFDSLGLNTASSNVNVEQGATLVLSGTATQESEVDALATSQEGNLTNAGILKLKINADFGSSLKNLGELLVEAGTTTTTADSLGIFGTDSEKAQGKVNVAKGATLKLTDAAITFSENSFADNRDSSVSNNQYGAGNIFNAGTIDASSAAVTITSDGSKETNGGSKNSNVLFMAGGELIAGSLDVEQKTVGSGAEAYIEDFTVLGGTLTVNGNISGDKGDIKVFAISGQAGSETQASFDGTLNLNNIKQTAANLTDINGIRVFGSADTNDTTKTLKATLNVSGAWNFNGASVKASSYGQVNFTKATVSDLGLIHAAKTNSAINLDASDLTAKGLYIEKDTDSGSLSLTNNSDLTVTGDVGAATGVTSGSINLAQNSSLTLTYDAATAEKAGETDTDAKDDGLASGVVVADSTSEIILTGYKNASGSTDITLDEIKELKDKLLGENYNGQFSLAGVNVTDAGINDKGEVSFENALIVGGSAGNVYEHATVTGVSGSINGTHNWGNAQLADNEEELSVGAYATVELNGEGALVADKSGALKGATLASGSTIGLNGSGSQIGAITASGDGVGTVQVAGAVQVDSIGKQGTAVAQVAVLGDSSMTLKGDVFTKTLDVKGAMDMGGKSISITGSGNNTIAGSVKNAKEVNVAGNLAVTGSLSADKVAFTEQGKRFTVGDAKNPASVSIADLDLNGGTASFDPDYDQAVSINSLFDGIQNLSKSITRANAHGNIEILRNNIVAIGASQAEAKEVVSKYVSFDAADGSLIADQVGSVLYQDAAYTVDDGAYVHISAAESVSGSGNTFVLEDHGAWVLSSDLIAQSNSQANAAIAFEGANAKVTLGSGSQIVLDGGQYFAADTVYLFSGSGLTVDDQGADVIAGSGLLSGQLDSNGNVSLGLSNKAADYLYAQSSPVKNMTLDVVGNKNGQYDPTESGVSYISAISAHKGGAAIEESARLAVYGGAMQALNMAQMSSTEAVAERMSSRDFNGKLVESNSLNGGGLWLSPVYKNHDSDGFSAQGVSYGADIDMLGMAMGGDWTSKSGLRLGGYINFGSGDASGQGTASDVSNDFSYFGLGLYAGQSFGDIGLSADIGYTQVSNDLSQSVNYNNINKVTADADTSAFTVGVNGEYDFKLGNANVVPHAGLRYTNLRVDSYDAKADGTTVAHTGSDSMNVFSIPVGVTVNSEFTSGDWKISPKFDVTLTANVGDTDVETSTTFVGAGNLNLSTEFMDKLTYGATVGVDASYDRFNIGAGVNYTGSSNASELGVSANVSFKF